MRFLSKNFDLGSEYRFVTDTTYYVQIKIKCPYCSKEKVGRRHFEEIHHVNGERNYFCTYCSESTTYHVPYDSTLDFIERAYIEAVQRHNCTIDPRTQCPICYKKVLKMTRHTREVHGQTSRKCPRCGNFFIHDLKEHVKTCNIKRAKKEVKNIKEMKHTENNQVDTEKPLKLRTQKTSEILSIKSKKRTKPGENNPSYIRKRGKINFELEDSDEDVDDPEWDPEKNE